MHVSLKPTFNFLMILVWVAIISGVTAYAPQFPLVPLFTVAVLLGAIIGFCQYKALSAHPDFFRNAQSAGTVRTALLQSSWGKASIACFWAFVFLLAVLAFILCQRDTLISFYAAYAVLALIRDVAALPAVLKLSKGQPPPCPPPA